MDGLTGIRWKQKPKYTVDGGERSLGGDDVVPLTHAPFVNGEEADGVVTMDSLAEMMHADVACLEEKTGFSKEGTVVSIEDGRAYKGTLDCLMATKTTALNTEELTADTAGIGALSAGALCVNGEITQSDGTKVSETYVRCDSNPVTGTSVTTRDEVSELAVKRLDGSADCYPIDTKAVLEAKELPQAPASKVYNVAAGSSVKVYSKDVELTTRKDFDALSVDCIHNAACTVCIATLDAIRAKGDAVLDGDLTINGNIYQAGSSYVTHAEDLNVSDSIVTLRSGATTAMASSDYAGITVTKYNGADDLNIFVDSSGVARLGKKSSLRPFLLRAEESSLSNGCPLVWDSANKRAVQGCFDKIISSKGCYLCIADSTLCVNAASICLHTVKGNSACSGLKLCGCAAASYGCGSRPMIVGAAPGTFATLKACYAASDPSLPYLGSLNDGSWYHYLLVPHRSGIQSDNNSYAHLFYTEMQNTSTARINACMITGSTSASCWKKVCVTVDCAINASCAACAANASCAACAANATCATCVPSYKSGPWRSENSGYAYVGSDGVVEIGTAIDFHQASDTGNCSARLCITSDSSRLVFRGQTLARVSSFDSSTGTLNLVS